MILYYKQSYILICFSVVQGFLLLLFVHLCVFFLKDTLERQKLLPYKVLFFFKLLFIYLFIYFIFGCVGSSFLCEGFLQLRQAGATLHRGARASLSWPFVVEHRLQSTGSVVVAHGPSCSVACGIFPDQGSNPCPLHQQADSQPLRHQRSPHLFFYCTEIQFF